MPKNPETGKPDRHKSSIAKVQEERLKKAKESRAEIKKGKRRADNSPVSENDDSPLVPSPSSGLVGLAGLTLESGTLSAADTPADSPAAVSPSSLMENPASAPPPAPNAHRYPKRRRPGMSSFNLPVTARAQDQEDFAVEVSSPSTSRLLKAPDRRSSHSRSDASPVSNDGSNSARFAAIEARQDEFERRQRELEQLVKDFIGGQKNAGV